MSDYIDRMNPNMHTQHADLILREILQEVELDGQQNNVLEFED